MGVKLNNEHWDDHILKLVETRCDDTVTILRNQQVQTGRTIPNNKLDIIIHGNEKGTCVLIDVAVSQETELRSRKKQRRFWNIKTSQ